MKSSWLSDVVYIITFVVCGEVVNLPVTFRKLLVPINGFIILSEFVHFNIRKASVVETIGVKSLVRCHGASAGNSTNATIQFLKCFFEFVHIDQCSVPAVPRS